MTHDPFTLNGEHPADRVLRQVPGVPAEHVAQVFHALADLTHQRHMLGPAITSLGSPDGVELGGEFAHSLGRYFHGLGEELDGRPRQLERRFRILITGSRDWASRELIAAAIAKANASLNPDNLPIVIVHGGCPTGADLIADGIAFANEWDVERHAARWAWDGGRRAGPVRNQRMAALGADVCLAFPRPGSRGTQSAIAAAQKNDIPTFVTTEAEGVAWSVSRLRMASTVRSPHDADRRD